MIRHTFLLDDITRYITIFDLADAIDMLAEWSLCVDPTRSGSVDLTDLTIHWDREDPDSELRTIDLAAREIVMILETISNSSQRHRCVYCAKRFGIGRLPVRYISVWPLQDGADTTDESVLGLCSACSVPIPLLWDDALDLFERCQFELHMRFEYARAKWLDENKP